MKAVNFPQANITIGPPSELDESQCRTIRALAGTVETGSIEGSQFIIVCHEPTPEERLNIAAGANIYLTMLGGLSPHFLTTTIGEAQSFA